MRRLIWIAALGVAVAVPAAAADLEVAKTTAAVSDLLGLANAHALPGAVVEHSITVTNPNALLSGNTVARVVIADDIPTSVSLRVADYGAANSGPVEFADGNLLGLGLTGSNLLYSYKGLGDLTDGLEFWDGQSWAYKPVSADGYDPRVRAIRVTLSRQQAPGSRFRLRYRVAVK